MSQASHSLKTRRLELCQRIDIERQDLRSHVQGIQGAIGSLVDGLSPARWLGTLPPLLVGGVVLTLVVGRRRMLQMLGAGMTIVELLRRYRKTSRVIGDLANPLTQRQAVRRSR